VVSNLEKVTLCLSGFALIISLGAVINLKSSDFEGAANSNVKEEIVSPAPVSSVTSRMVEYVRANYTDWVRAPIVQINGTRMGEAYDYFCFYRSTVKTFLFCFHEMDYDYWKLVTVAPSHTATFLVESVELIREDTHELWDAMQVAMKQSSENRIMEIVGAKDNSF
jgi:hypothetical protein